MNNGLNLDPHPETMVTGTRLRIACTVRGQNELVLIKQARSLYVFCEYVQRLQTLFKNNTLNVSFRETVRLISLEILSVQII